MKKHVFAVLAGAALFAAGMAGAGSVYADDITDSIDEGLEYYQKGQYSEAVGSLNYASQLINQKKGGHLASMLPEPLEGWTAQEATSDASGAALFTGVSASRQYEKEDASVSVQILTDAPMIQGMMMMFTNPMLAASEGGKLEKIGREKAIVQYSAEEKNGDIKIMVDRRFLVIVEGSEVSKADLTAYAERVDYKKLTELP